MEVRGLNPGAARGAASALKHGSISLALILTSLKDLFVFGFTIDFPEVLGNILRSIYLS